MGERQDDQRWVEETRAEYLRRTTPPEGDPSEEWVAVTGFLFVLGVVVAAAVAFDVLPCARAAWGKLWQ